MSTMEKSCMNIKEEDCEWESVYLEQHHLSIKVEEDYERVVCDIKEDSEPASDVTNIQKNETIGGIKKENLKSESECLCFYPDEKDPGLDLTPSSLCSLQHHLKSEYLESYMKKTAEALGYIHHEEDFIKSGNCLSSLAQTSLQCRSQQPPHDESMKKSTCESESLRSAFLEGSSLLGDAIDTQLEGLGTNSSTSFVSQVQKEQFKRESKCKQSRNRQKLYSCSECGRQLTLKSSLKKHMRIHTGERPYSCSTCDKRFSTSGDLRIHTRIHTREKPYCCSDCGKQFYQLTRLLVHMKIHTGEQQCCCFECGKQFLHSSSLQTHMRIHTGEKSFCCSDCGNGFSSNALLRTHTRIHSGEKPYCCSECGKRFSDRSSLRRHMKIHTDTNNEWPQVWTAKQKEDFQSKNPWLGFKSRKLGCLVCSTVSIDGNKEKGVSFSREWMNFEIQASGLSSRETSLSALRNKVRKHALSKAHIQAVKIKEQQKEATIENAMEAMTESYMKETEAVFRTAYHLAKRNRPFADHESLMELQELNGIKMGSVLHSCYSATQIIEHVANEMKKKIVSSIIASSSKLAVLVDETSSLNRKAVMTVSVKASFEENSPEFIFLELVELENQRADGIAEALLSCLTNAGFMEEWLHENWVTFVCDGASAVLGKKSGVATRLTSKFPRLFVWHCMNHRLELAVSDAVDEVNSVNHFKAFMQKLYSLYSASDKNEHELKDAAAEVESQLLRIGRVLDVRWVASSFRTVHAVWTSLEALVQHFKSACHDETRSSKEKQMYRGLLDRVQSPEFLCDLGLMYDTLHELSLLSQELQARSVTLLRADHLLKCTLRVIHSFKESPGQKYSEALEAEARGRYRSVALKQNAKLTSIHPRQFLQSIVNNLEQRLSFEDEIIKDLSILDQSKWPSNPSIRHGEEQIKRLCKRFNLCEDQALNGMRDLLEEPNSKPKDLKPLINCMKTFPVSTAECGRNFSLMNNINTDKRAVLLVSNISNLMMININGPPTSKFEPQKYTRTWLMSHHTASSRQCRVKTPVESKSVWRIL
ncbi:E3 SUMO-protein ligase KIAA1586-like [Polypterus senegalus]|uniref:E3 SUMO-protein ligase KIAA1586-like n=1 Tax=Polypterus senegalus TaxID=55291 RepID=UPI0019640C16|nr:E3 SUMO-protein ligase KIAA1586-like [Polypterus senegalus]